ncbi:MAG TPA: hypothetical protein DCQ93_06965 [Bacteroidetes bacterium]|nr:hypothetical protein [Bacteroidota bacterium]
MQNTIKPKSVDEYYKLFPKEIHPMISEMRNIIQKAAPKAKEIISYNMPAYKQHGVLVYFAAYKNHIGFYPTSSGVRVFADELKAYKTSKGAIQFPINEKLPVKLIQKIVRFRVNEDKEKFERKILLKVNFSKNKKPSSVKKS